MFEKYLIANCGEQPPTGGAAAQHNCIAAEGREGVFTAGTAHV